MGMAHASLRHPEIWTISQILTLLFMNCPVCQKFMNEGLSICPSCGSMVDDEIREEVMGSVHVSKPLKIEMVEEVSEPFHVEEEVVEMVFDSEDELVIDISDEQDGPVMDEADTRELTIESLSEEAQSLPLFDSIPETPENVTPEIQEELSEAVAEPIATTIEVEATQIDPVAETIPTPTESLVMTTAEPTEERVARDTAPIRSRNTGRIVVDFQNKNSDEPDWKQAVRNKLRGQGASIETVVDAADETVVMLKTGTEDAVGVSSVETNTQHQDSERNTVTNSVAPDLLKERAIRRIAESRRRFSSNGGSTTGIGGTGMPPEENTGSVTIEVERLPQPKTETTGTKGTGGISPPGRPPVKLRLAPELPVNRSTNRLDSPSEEAPQKEEDAVRHTRPSELHLVNRETEQSKQVPSVVEEEQLDDDVDVIDEPHQPGLPEMEDVDDDSDEYYELEEEDDEYEEEIEDIAPLGQRFNAGLFDMLICAFASLIGLAPYIAMGGDILSTSGMLLFVAVCGVITLSYQTLSLSLRGKTFGMRLFALEVIDIEENEYPTFGQAFVSSLLFVLSLATLGLGFISILFSPEKRALHDFASGTLMVREY